MVALGEGFSPSTDPIEQVGQELEDRIMARVAGMVEALKTPAPVVHVESPPAPNVTVNSPVEMPETETINVEFPGIKELVTVLKDVRAQLAKPVTRTVTRDDQGLIQTVTETR